MIIAGILGLIQWIIIGFLTSIIGLSFMTIPGAEWFGTIWMICGVIGIILSIIVLVGGVMAIKKKNWAFALIGSIIGLVSVGFYLGSLLSLIALILIVISKDEFK